MPARASRHAECVAELVLERRGKERTPAEGEVVIFFEDPEPVEIHGRLADLSSDGFRASHSFPGLCSGQVVRFQHPFSAGKARVIWNRVTDSHVESGFLILSE